MLNNLREICETYRVSTPDAYLAGQIVGDPFKTADLILSPDGVPYLYRWHVVPRNDRGNVYFHIQVRSDPERPRHDHPWDNCTTILAGAYLEDFCPTPASLRQASISQVFLRTSGQVIRRQAADAHRLIMPLGTHYTMTLFTTGPKIRGWGFWYPHGWVSNKEVCITDGNVSTHKQEMGKCRKIRKQMYSGSAGRVEFNGRSPG